MAPLAVPAFVNSFGWVSLTSRVEGFGGALLVVTLSYYPLVYLPVAAALRGLDPALEETALSLGHGPWRTFPRVTLPQLRPAMYGGALLVGLHLLAEFGALQLLRFDTFTTAIYDQYRSSFNGPAATMLASVLVLCCLVLLLLEMRVRGHHRYARVGGGVARSLPRRRLGLLAPSRCWLRLTLLVGLALGVPMGSLVALAGRRHLHRVPGRRAGQHHPEHRRPRAGRRGADARAGPAGRVARRSATAAGSPPSPSAAPTSATPCPASSSPSRW